MCNFFISIFTRERTCHMWKFVQKFEGFNFACWHLLLPHLHYSADLIFQSAQIMAVPMHLLNLVFVTRFFRKINPYIIFQGLPLHVQIDTFEETKDTGPVHRGYCQVKVFCDKVGVSHILCNISYICPSEIWGLIIVMM